MDFRFDNKDLEKLYVEGRSKKLKLTSEIIDKFFARIQQIEAAYSIYDLMNNKSLKFEKLQGFDSRFSIRLNIKYRLEFEINWLNSEKTVGEFTILNISNHYA